MSTLNQFSYPVYDYAVGWFNRQPVNALDFIAPALPVDGITGTYKCYPQGYAFRAVDTRRAPYSTARAIDVGTADLPYLLEDHSLRIGIDDAELKPGAGNKQEAADQIAQAKINSLLATWRTSAIVDGLAHFRAAVPAKDGVGKWTAADSNPIDELRAINREFRATNGVNINRWLFSNEAWDTLANNASVLDLVAYNDAKVLTPELLFKLLGLTGEDGSAPKLIKATVPLGTQLPGPGVPFVGSNALASDVWMTYVDDGSLIGNMTGMRTLHAGGETPVESVESYYARPERTTWYEVGLHRQYVVPAPSCNVRLTIN